MTENLRTTININTALIYMKIGKTREAEQYYREILGRRKPSYNYGVALVNITHLLNEQGRFDESLQLIDTHRDAFTCLNTDLFSTYLMGNHAVALAGKGRYQEAYDELMKSKLRTDSIYFNTRTEESVLNFEIDNLTVEKEEGQATIRQKNIWLWILAAVLILISASAVTAGIVSRRRRDRERKRSDELEEKCGELEETIRALEAKKEEMAGAISSQTLRTEHLMRTIGAVGAYIGDSSMSPAKKVNEINKVVKQADISGDTWQLLSMSFETINPAFFKSLAEKCADLTTNDMRLAAYILMNLTTKEIAELTGRSVRSVDSARYRLARKLNIGKSESLATFLRSL